MKDYRPHASVKTKGKKWVFNTQIILLFTGLAVQIVSVT
jgi:hypothetical protein